MNQLEQFTFLKVKNQHVVGISTINNNPEWVLVTIQAQGVYIYNLHDQKCIKSWLFGPLFSFTHHTLYHHLKHQLFAVQDDNHILSWHEQDTTLSKMKRASFSEDSTISIFDLEELTLESKIKVIQTSMDYIQIIYVESHMNSKKDFFIFLITRSKSKKDSSLDDATSKFKIISSHPLEVPINRSSTENNNNKFPEISTVTFDYEKWILTLFWTNGWLEIYKIPDQSVKNQPYQCYYRYLLNIYDIPRPVPKNTTELLCPKMDILSKNGNSFVKSHILQHGFVVLVGPSSHQDNLLNSKIYPQMIPLMVTIWDQTFGIIRAHFKLHIDLDDDDLIEKKPPGDFNESLKLIQPFQVIAIPNTDIVLFNLGQSIISCRIHLSSSSLANSLSTFHLTQQFMASDSDPSTLIKSNSQPSITSLSTPSSLRQPSNAMQYNFISKLAHENPSFSQSKSIAVDDQMFSKLTKDESAYTIEVIQTLSNKQKTPDYQSFIKIFYEYLEKINTHPDLPQRYIQSVPQSTHLDAYNALGFKRKRTNLDVHQPTGIEVIGRSEKKVSIYPEAFMSSVARRCLDEHFLSIPLRHLIETNHLSYKNVPDLLPRLMSQERFDLIAISLVHIPDISEMDLIQLIKWLINQVQPSSLQIFINEYYANLNQSKITENSQKDRSQELEEKWIPKKKQNRNKWNQAGARNIEEDQVNEIGEKSGINGKEELEHFQSPLQRYLNVIINVPLTPVFMQQCVHQLNLNEALEILKYASSWTQYYINQNSIIDVKGWTQDQKIEKFSITRDLFSLPILPRIIPWVNMVIDSRLSELVLVADCERLLRKLQSTLAQIIAFYDQMHELRACLSNYYDSEPSPLNTISDYTIEVLRL